MTSRSLTKPKLTLLDQWQVNEALPTFPLLSAVEHGRVLVGGRYQDGCLLLDLTKQVCTKEGGPQPKRIAIAEKVGLYPEKGIRDLSVSTRSGQTIAAVAAKGLYASCWNINTGEGWALDDQAHAVSVSPNGSAVAVGLGKWVLDSVTPAQAEVVIWDIPEDEVQIRRKLPGACVVKLLWIRNEDGLIYDNIYNAAQCSWLNELIIVTTITRDQRGGFVALLDPKFLRILEIADIAEAGNLWAIAAWPQARRLWVGGFRHLEDSFHDPRVKPWQKWAPRKTALGSMDLWLSEDRLLRLEHASNDGFIVQIFGLDSSDLEADFEETTS